MNNLKSYIKQRDRKSHGFSELVKQEKAKLVSLIKDKKRDGKTSSPDQSSQKSKIVAYEDLKELYKDA